MSDQDRISPYNINIIPSRQVMRIKEKYQLGDYKLIQFQILQTNITRTVWQTVSRITNEILGVKELMVNGQAMVKQWSSHQWASDSSFKKKSSSYELKEIG